METNYTYTTDIAIVGGGVSGIYTAWRLIQNNLSESEILKAWAAKRPDGKLKIGVFERSSRIGGRLLSLTPPGMPNMRAELGAMHYTSNQILLRSLIENKFNLKTYDFPGSYPENILYLRGVHLREQDLSEPEKVPYNMQWHEKRKSANELVAAAIEQILPGAKDIPASQWHEVKQTALFDGVKLYKQGFRNVLNRVMSNEAYEFIRYAGGFDTILSNWNAADAIAWYLAYFGPDAEYRGIVDGFESIALKLKDEFVTAGGEVHLNCELRSFHNCTLEDNTNGIELRFQNNSTVRCRRLILAMPRRSLELLDRTNSILDPNNLEVRQMIESVSPQPLLKIFLCYNNPWWQATSVHSGKSNTDLPV
ncbi:MAG: FAD-dependent oxidoreductase, partial [Crinalium sp.]